MRKVVSGCMAGALLCTVLFSAAACTTEKADVSAPAFDNAQASISVNGDMTAKGVVDISDELFGAFLEDINYASYALADELLANGSFETATGASIGSWDASHGATLSHTASGGVLSGVSEYAAEGINAAHASLSLPAGSEGTLTNVGNSFDPIAVESGVGYVFSAFVKSSKDFTMKVRVTDGTTAVYEVAVPVKANEKWVKYSREATASASKSEKLKLEITFESVPEATTIELDGVSLVTKDATLGIKNYIYRAIEDLSPAFIRFPGGCIIEGDGSQGIRGAYDWKNSIGAVKNGNEAGDDVLPEFSYLLDTNGTPEQVTTYGERITRKHNTDRWGYDMDYALGFYDYFLLCESVGASAVPVLNCGLSCQGGGVGAAVGLSGRHGKKVEDYIQDALDLVEFARGDKNTKWGAVRAALGHEEPFEMHYVGIGNEQSGIYYSDYYEKFLLPFKKAREEHPEIYGDVQIIVGNGPLFEQCENTDTNSKGLAQAAAERFLSNKNSNSDGNGGKIIETLAEYGVHDHHYYRNYLDFFQHHTMYDRYTREYHVFVGEYSANEATTLKGEDFGFDGFDWRNSWITAISEAAMMTGFERNGDVVDLAAYAPMYAPWSGNVTGAEGAVANRQWPVDMMYFTNTELVLTTNYYVQQLFMKNAGTALPVSSIEYAKDFNNTRIFEGKSGNDTVEQEAEKLYYVVSKDEGTGDLIVKIVNASAEEIKVNVAFKNANLKGIAHATVLQNDDYKAVNTLENLSSPAVSPETYSIGGFTRDTFGYAAKPYSVAAFRVHVR